MTKITKLNGIGFLAFPEQKDFLVSELNGRFNFTVKPDEAYGDLLFYSDKQAFLQASNGK